mmetsp:Transcript_10097/g.35376  ORF Transcript_10097/g.35376 Transcript_10097/m.35376 type:complete len:229 (-) Transcript_10097:110-796(-)
MRRSGAAGGAGGGGSGVARRRDAKGREIEDFDEEARKLFASLNLTGVGGSDSPHGRMYNDLDAVWRHPTSGGTVYIGNHNAAQSLDILAKHKIKHIVNCQEATAPNFHEAKPEFKYLRFPVAYWWSDCGKRTPQAVEAYFRERCFDWVDKAVGGGHNVLIHCLAGAHRAGTTGTAYVMHAAELDYPTALKATKTCRPIVNPISSLGEALRLLDKGMAVKRSAGAFRHK